MPNLIQYLFCLILCTRFLGTYIFNVVIVGIFVNRTQSIKKQARSKVEVFKKSVPHLIVHRSNFPVEALTKLETALQGPPLRLEHPWELRRAPPLES